MQNEATAIHRVDPEKCKGDGVCVEVCSKRVLELHEGKARTALSRESRCMACGQCVAVCPTGALSMDRVPAENLHPVAKWNFGRDELLAFLRARRSARVFKDKPVTAEDLAKVLEIAATAPMAFEPTTEILVLDTREKVERLVGHTRESYRKLLRIHGNPVGRAIIRWKRGAETAHSLASHVIGIVEDNNAQHDRDGSDRYTYGAPAVMLFHANRWSVGYHETAMITATYAMLGAHAIGLGATMLSMLPPVINNFPENRRAWGVPDDNVVVIALTLGYPKYKFARTIARPLKGVRFA